ncbi:MAG TPA: hypothetical protein VFQ35_22175 [Polyangiaceae bacterium]|nr:hypothetical protein [Polyangiaceae bacterium]
MTSRFRTIQENDSVPLGRSLTVVLFSVLVGGAAVGASVLLSGARIPKPSFAPPSSAPTSMPEQSLIERTARGAHLHSAQRAALERYAWVDRDAGIVSIPIDRAIELKAEKEP